MARVDDQFRSPPRHSNSDFNDLGCRLARLLVGHLWFNPHANLVGLFIFNDGHYLPRLLVSVIAEPVRLRPPCTVRYLVRLSNFEAANH
jgi:hypothetical protein